jgi:ribose/xylose/arabinose/galactoside ABC-type transport system permease subunit
MPNKRKTIQNYLLDYGIVLVLIVLFIFFSVISDRFLQTSTIFTILKQVSMTGIISVGMAFVMLTGGIDLSVGAVAGVTSVLAAVMMTSGGMSIFAACAVCLAIAAMAGFINGVCVNAFNIPPLIGTLGVMTSLRGVAYLISNGSPVYGFDASVKNFAQGSIGFVPFPVILMILVFIIGAFVLFQTRTGRYIYSVGGNEEASRLSGIKVHKIKYLVYAISGLLSGVAGLVLLSRTNSGQPSAGAGYEMDAITAVVLGGVSINGGKGNIWLVVVGVVIMGTLSTGMVMNNINDYVQQVIKGLVLIGAVAFAQFSQKVKEKNVIV